VGVDMAFIHRIEPEMVTNEDGKDVPRYLRPHDA